MAGKRFSFNLSAEGWDMADLGVAIAAVAALTVVTLSLAFAALKSRVA